MNSSSDTSKNPAQPGGPKPVAFMIMPFGKKTLPQPIAKNLTNINCDLLWDKVFSKVLEDLGYLAIRADADDGSVIVKDMLERLAFADLVLADLTFPNANVYYEVGIRHVAQKEGCVLIAAKGSQQLFDVGQMRTIPYELKNGRVTDEDASKIRRQLKTEIAEKLAMRTPYYELVNEKNEDTVFRQQIKAIADFQTQARAIRHLSDKDQVMDKINQLRENQNKASLAIPEVTHELFTLIRDCLGWQEVLDFIDTLPDTMQSQTFFNEQKYLAKSKLGDHNLAIEGLKGLIALHGESAEGFGLLGGRFKKLWSAKETHRRENTPDKAPCFEEKGFLSEAINYYTKGMECDYNEFYCMSNLPTLLRARANEGDVDEAEHLDLQVVKVCQRKINRNEDDGWVRQTQLGAAFRSRDLTVINELAEKVISEGGRGWKLQTTLDDIDNAISQIKEGSLKNELHNISAELRKHA